MTLYLFTSDTHNGGDTALMPPTTLTPNTMTPILMNKEQSEIQKIIYEQWEDVAREAKKIRKFGEQIVWIMNGDAVEGDHHNTKELVTKYEVNQAYMHIQCVNDFRKIMGWKKTDRMVYTDGTDCHVGEFERLASEHLKAEHYPVVKKKTPAGQLWVAHHGPGAGSGANEGRALGNKARIELVAALANNITPPRFLVYSHFHKKLHAQIEIGDYIVDAFILPSFQYKTKYGHRVAPFEPTNIGGMSLQINRDGSFNYEWHVARTEVEVLE